MFYIQFLFEYCISDENLPIPRGMYVVRKIQGTVGSSNYHTVGSMTCFASRICTDSQKTKLPRILLTSTWSNF